MIDPFSTVLKTVGSFVFANLMKLAFKFAVPDC